MSPDWGNVPAWIGSGSFIVAALALGREYRRYARAQPRLVWTTSEGATAEFDEIGEMRVLKCMCIMIQRILARLQTLVEYERGFIRKDCGNLEYWLEAGGDAIFDLEYASADKYKTWIVFMDIFGKRWKRDVSSAKFHESVVASSDGCVRLKVSLTIGITDSDTEPIILTHQRISLLVD